MAESGITNGRLVLHWKGYPQAYDGAAAEGAVGGELPAQQLGTLLHAGQPVSHRAGSLGSGGRIETDTIVGDLQQHRAGPAATSTRLRALS